MVRGNYKLIKSIVNLQIVYMPGHHTGGNYKKGESAQWCFSGVTLENHSLTLILSPYMAILLFHYCCCVIVYRSQNIHVLLDTREIHTHYKTPKVRNTILCHVATR
eukprot:sb/3477830/